MHYSTMSSLIIYIHVCNYIHMPLIHALPNPLGFLEQSCPLKWMQNWAAWGVVISFWAHQLQPYPFLGSLWLLQISRTPRHSKAEASSRVIISSTATHLTVTFLLSFYPISCLHFATIRPFWFCMTSIPRKTPMNGRAYIFRNCT